MLNFYRITIYDHNISKYLVKGTKNYEWIIKEINSKDSTPMFKLFLNIDNKKFKIKSISFTGASNSDIKIYSLESIKNIIMETNNLFNNKNISNIFSVIPLCYSNFQKYTDIINNKNENICGVSLIQDLLSSNKQKTSFK